MVALDMAWSGLANFLKNMFFKNPSEKVALGAHRMQLFAICDHLVIFEVWLGSALGLAWLSLGWLWLGWVWLGPGFVDHV